MKLGLARGPYVQCGSMAPAWNVLILCYNFNEGSKMVNGTKIVKPGKIRYVFKQNLI